MCLQLISLLKYLPTAAIRRPQVMIASGRRLRSGCLFSQMMFFPKPVKILGAKLNQGCLIPQ
jgi:hypothetical protein